VGFDAYFVRTVDKGAGDDVYEFFHPKARFRIHSSRLISRSGLKPPHSKEKLGMKKRPG
jgi:hypothetical protein